MQLEKYNPNTISVSAILNYIKTGEIAIPEIQRPFVWKKRQVRDLLDSLYKGYPTGYLIIWKNPSVRLKDGSYSAGKKILIDGQQRVTALMTAVAGIPVVNADYQKERVKIAFNPFMALSYENGDGDKDTEIFAVQDSSHLKSKRWIPDISIFFETGFSIFTFIRNFCEANKDEYGNFTITEEELNLVLTNLTNIANRMIGVIELSDDLDIDIVTDIFIRINSKGTALSQGDFVMSKIASDELHGGNMLRKTIDYFAHLCVKPDFYSYIAENDKEFVGTEYFNKIAWLKDDKETVYDPNCDDVIRVAFMSQYYRSKLADLVNLLSGRNFETRDFEDGIVEDTYSKLKTGVLSVINEYNFENFMLAIKGAGYISPKLINSRLALDFAYALYLRLIKDSSIPTSEVKHIVQRWYVFSVLTGRYSFSPESSFYKDLKKINEVGVKQAFSDMEEATLSDNFWDIAIPQNLEVTSTINPTYLVYLAAQIKSNDISLLSNNLTVKELINCVGDVHHIFPKEYLKSNGFDKNLYNQVANFAYLDSQVNKSIGKMAPKEYFSLAVNQCEDKVIKIGSIIDLDALKQNLSMNCIPYEAIEGEHSDYIEFLSKRRKMMAKKIKDYYYSL